MRKYLFFSIILLLNFNNTSHAQEIKSLKGIKISPYIFNMSDLPSFGDFYLGGEIKGNFNEAEPPYAPKYPSPDAKDIPHMTYDLNTSNSPFAPTAGINFEGIAQGGYIPSEPQPAVGPNNIFVLGNVSVKITDKSGNTLSSVTQTTFFNIPVAEGAGFDAKCFYDYRRGRFVALCETQTASPKVCNYYLAISASSNAMGTWYVYVFNMKLDGAASTNNWSDFPGLGISDDKLVMSGQQFSFGGNLYQYQKLRIIDRTLAYSGSSLSYVDIVNWSGQKFVTKPGRNMSVGNDIYIFATTFSGGTSVEFRTLTGTPASPVLSTGTTISVASYGASPASVPGGSSSSTVNTGDSRTPDFFVRNGVLNIAFHMGAVISGTSVSAIKFLRIQVNPLNTTPLTDETYGAASTYYYYPMVCLDSAGTMFMGFGRSSTSEFPSSYVTGKRRTDASIQSSTLAKSGTAVTTQTRWGDYSGIDMDESATNPGVTYAWYSGQFTKAANNFGTWVTQLSYTYGQISGQVLDDADGDVSTTGDRTPVQGVTVTLKQGAVTLNSLLTDASGNYNFGYLETAANYNLVFTPPSAKHSVDVIIGTGGNAQSKTDYKTIAVSLTNAQISSGNKYIISDWLNSIASGNWNSTSTWIDNTTPSGTEKVLINSATSVTINSNYSCQKINVKGSLLFDNVSPRTLTISSNLNLANGNITLGNNDIVTAALTGASATAYFITNGTGQLKQNISNNVTYVLFPVGPTASAYNPVNIQLDISSTPDIFGVRVSNTITHTPYVPNEVIQKEWNISEQIAGGSNATVQYFFSAGDFGTAFNPSLSPNVYDVGHYNTSLSSYEVFTGAISGPVSGLYNISGSGLQGFSPFVVGDKNSILGALPVELAAFNYNISERNVKLLWTTEQEINNKGFEIQKSTVGNNPEWNVIGFINGKINSNNKTDYSFEDKKLNSGKYQYRLKQIDLNGNYKYYNLNYIIDVTLPVKFSLSQNYPNPFNPVTKIDYELPSDSRVRLVVFDVLGREVNVMLNGEMKQAGYYTAELNASNLASGIYFYRLIANSNGNNIVFSKRMVVLK